MCPSLSPFILDFQGEGGVILENIYSSQLEENRSCPQT